MNARFRTLAPAVAALAVASALLLSACGGGVSVSSGDAAASIGPSGEVSISSSDGSLVVGPSALPDGFPSDVPTPEGFTIAAAATTTVDGRDNFTITFQADGDKTAAVTSYVDGLKSDGYKVDSEFAGGADGGVWQLSNKDWKVGIIASKADAKTAVIVNVAPADS